jgi:hypothetical protein
VKIRAGLVHRRTTAMHRLDSLLESSFETTVLLTVDETMEAIRKAEEVKYRAPGA